ncbi:MAG: hypothetical protein NVS9B1_05370 [Candidatus Dormibacteraceae bacterium]
MCAAEASQTRVRLRLPARAPGFAVVVALGELTLFNVYQLVSWLPRSLGQNDFRLYYSAATIGLHHGWGRIYDAGLQRAGVAAAWPMAPGIEWFPYVNPPPLAWLVAPLTLLPAPVAYVPWVILVAVSLVVASQLAAPSDPLHRIAFAGLGLGFLPTFVAVAYGQPAPLLVLALALAWWLLARDRQVAAGVVLSLMVIKPQVALLVPLALLVAGWTRAFLTWLVVAGSLAVVSLLLLGTSGVAQYLALAGPLYADTYFQRWSLTSLVGGGPAWYAAVAAAVAATLLTATRCRREPGHVIAIGVAGSLLINHYLTPADFTVLLVPIWLLARAGGAAWLPALLGAGWIAGWFSLAFGGPVIAFEVTLLAVAGGGLLAPVRPVPGTPALAP